MGAVREQVGLESPKGSNGVKGTHSGSWQLMQAVCWDLSGVVT